MFNTQSSHSILGWIDHQAKTINSLKKDKVGYKPEPLADHIGANTTQSKP